MEFASEESYEEMISALQTFMSEAEEECSTMEAAGNDCVENTENDPAAETSNAKLQKCVGDIRTALESIQGIVTALQEELEAIREAAAKANAAD